MRRDLNDLRDEIQALTKIIQEVQWERKYDRDMAARDRENLILRLETYLLRKERGLPPPDPNEPLF